MNPYPPVIVDLLSLVVSFPIEIAPKIEQHVSAWSEVQCLAAERWASAAHLRASDNYDVAVPQEPLHVFELRQEIQLWRGDNLENITRMPEMPPRK